MLLMALTNIYINSPAKKIISSGCHGQDSLGWKRWFAEEKAESADLPRECRELCLGYHRKLGMAGCGWGWVGDS